jgi:hypothetical protein
MKKAVANSISLPIELREIIKAEAEKEHRTFSGMIIHILWDWVKLHSLDQRGYND